MDTEYFFFRGEVIFQRDVIFREKLFRREVIFSPPAIHWDQTVHQDLTICQNLYTTFAYLLDTDRYRYLAENSSSDSLLPKGQVGF